ncbi:MAG: divTM7 [Candidatus Saccharibacteria bacterium]|nr:divTM7 [Candidatus Saccharibacteria bacterium]
MDETPKVVEFADNQTFWDQHRFLLLIAITIVTALILVVISMVIYNVSGSAQLDLSRPGYQSVSDKVDKVDNIDEYNASGPVNKSTVDEFTKLYDAQATKAKAVNAYNGDPLNPEVLEFGSSESSE